MDMSESAGLDETKVILFPYLPKEIRYHWMKRCNQVIYNVYKLIFKMWERFEDRVCVIDLTGKLAYC